MAIVMGPVLKFCGCDPASSKWNLSVVVVTDGSKDPLTFESAGARGTVQPDPNALYQHTDGRTVHRYRFSLALGAAAERITYTIAEKSAAFWLPAKGAAPRIAYGSCNGFSSAKVMNSVKENKRNALWERMQALHAGKPYNLLMLGGDQVYADSMWDAKKNLGAWHEREWKDANKAACTARMITELKDFYFDLYVSRWKQAFVSDMLAAIPTVMMWDDHDIIDGWGSYPKERHECAVFTQLMATATWAFGLFQQQLAPGETRSTIAPGNGFTFGHVIGSVAILALDMRFERTEKQVLSLAHWNLAYDWLERIAQGSTGVDHLIVMSSIPVVYPSFDLIEQALGFLPGQQELEDDLRDHWNSQPHKGEQVRLIHRLLDYAATHGIRPTIISGDVHVAALGLIESTRKEHDGNDSGVISQFISSGIVHPAPPGIMLFALRHLFDDKNEVERGITARMAEFPGTQYRFVGQRNFLALEFDAQPKGTRMWANWFVEGQDDPFVKAVHAI